MVHQWRMIFRQKCGLWTKYMGASSHNKKIYLLKINDHWPMKPCHFSCVSIECVRVCVLLLRMSCKTILKKKELNRATLRYKLQCWFHNHTQTKRDSAVWNRKWWSYGISVSTIIVYKLNGQYLSRKFNIQEKKYHHWLNIPSPFAHSASFYRMQQVKIWIQFIWKVYKFGI